MSDERTAIPTTTPGPNPRPALLRRGAGAPILLLHGWGLRGDLWRRVIYGLEDDFDVIAPDFPGFGSTESPPAPWGVSDYMNWTIALMDELGIKRASVIGHSFGGRVAIKLAALHPERVEKLVLTDAAGIRPKRTLAYHYRVRLFKATRWLSKQPLAPARLRAWAAARITSQGSADYKAASGTVRGSFVRVVNEDLRKYLPRIHTPTLLIWGERDMDTPLADGQLMEKLIPDAGLVVFPGATHMAYLQESARFNVIVKTFLLGQGNRE
ncbi:MAG TPA: alpha/beta hydrolase [Ktedonobacterales bacterium]